jgi:hypothetical protein
MSRREAVGDRENSGERSSKEFIQNIILHIFYVYTVSASSDGSASGTILDLASISHSFVMS